MTLDLSLDNRTVLNSEVDCAIQELDILFNTVNTEVLGKPEYGTNFEQFLWTLTPTTESLHEYVRQKIQETYFAKRFVSNIEVTTEPGDLRDIYYVAISMNIPPTTPDYPKKSRRVFMLT